MVRRLDSPPRRWAVLACLVACLTAAACSGPRRIDYEVPPAPTPLKPCVRAKHDPLPAGPLTVDRAVLLALERNPDLGMAQARIAQARGVLSGACAARNPHITGDVSVLGADAPSMYLMKRIDAGNLGPTTDFNDPGAFGNLEIGATLRYNLWDGGRKKLGIWAAEAGVGGAKSQRDAVANQLAAMVVIAFLQTRAAEELLQADDASVRTVEAQVNETRVLVDNGRALRSDLLSLEVRLARAKERRIRTDVARRNGIAALRRLLALPLDASIVLAEPSLEGGDLPSERESALVEAYRHRPEARVARQAVKGARIEMERARRGSYPSLDLQARWYADDEGVEFSRSNWWIAVALTFDLWDGGRTRANVMQARAVVEGLEERDRRALLDIAHDVETAYLSLEEARAREAVAVQAVGAADETLVLVETQYRAGMATITRFLEVEGDRTRARTDRIRASLDLNRAVVNARRALGRLGRETWR